MIIVSVVKKNNKAKRWGLVLSISFVTFIVAVASTDTSSTPVNTSKPLSAEEKAKLEADAKAKAEKEKADAEAKAKAEAEARAKELDTFKASCKPIPYKDLARNPDNFNGNHVLYTGKVIQVMEDGNDIQLRVNITKDDYGYYDDTIFVTYTKKSTEGRILEDDIITIWGTANGNITYTTVLGSEMTIPRVDARVVKVN